MGGADQVRRFWTDYTELLDRELAQFFSTLPPYDLYKQLAYFMGFYDEQFAPVAVPAGKRFRACLCLEVGAGYGVREAVLPAALSIELFHNFSLIHDDIVDGDELRRGRPTVWKQFGIDHAINSGDMQLLLALSVLSGTTTDSVEQMVAIERLLMQQYRSVIEGQYLDFMLTAASLGDAVVIESTYYEMIEKKTADLLVAATVSAGMVAGVSAAERDALLAYARHLGLAYQLCDDVVSIWSTGDVTGKRDFGDLKERKKTLPILHAYAQLSVSDQRDLESLFNGTKPLSDQECHKIVGLLDTVECKRGLQQRIAEHAASAKAAAESLSLSAVHKERLCSIVDILLPVV